MHAAPATAHLRLVLQSIVGCVGLHQGRWSVAHAMTFERSICKPSGRTRNWMELSDACTAEGTTPISGKALVPER